MLSQKSAGLVQTNQIAERLKTSAASVTDMIKKLATKEFLQYTPYRGVKLTEQGYSISTSLVRSHRLWEVFLVDCLKYDWSKVHEIAEQLEHVISEDLVDRLSEFLGHPHFDPHGDPIPDASGKYRITQRIAMDKITNSGSYIMTGLTTDEYDFMQLLNSYHIKIGTVIEVIEIFPYDKSVKTKIENELVVIPPSIANKLLVSVNRTAK